MMLAVVVVDVSVVVGDELVGDELVGEELAGDEFVLSVVVVVAVVGCGVVVFVFVCLFCDALHDFFVLVSFGSLVEISSWIHQVVRILPCQRVGKILLVSQRSLVPGGRCLEYYDV